MEKSIFVAAFLLLASSAFPAVVDWDALDCEKTTYQGVQFKDAKITLPKNLAGLLNGETVNLRVSSSGGSRAVLLSGKVDNGVLYELECDEKAGATIEVRTTGPVIERIASSESPMKEFKAARGKGEIDFIPYTSVTYVKTLFMSLIMLFY